MKDLIIVILLAIVTVESFACQCVYKNKRREIRALIEQSHYIIIGRAKEVYKVDKMPAADSLFLKNYLGYLGQDDTKSPQMTFMVTSSFKGSRETKIIVEQELSTCTRIFTVGGTYLIFGQQRNDGTIDTSTCSSFVYDDKSRFIKRILKQLDKIKTG